MTQKQLVEAWRLTQSRNSSFKAIQTMAKGVLPFCKLALPTYLVSNKTMNS